MRNALSLLIASSVLTGTLLASNAVAQVSGTVAVYCKDKKLAAVQLFAPQAGTYTFALTEDICKDNEEPRNGPPDALPEPSTAPQKAPPASAPKAAPAKQKNQVTV